MKILLYISLGIALFLTHAPLLFTISPGESRPDFAFSLIFVPEYAEMIIVSILKSLSFSCGTIAIIQLMKNSKRSNIFKGVSIWFFAALDGLGWLLYINWMDIDDKNNISSVYYAILFFMLIGFIAFLSVEHQINKIETRETKAKRLEKEGLSQRKIARELDISLSTVNRILNEKK